MFARDVGPLALIDPAGAPVFVARPSFASIVADAVGQFPGLSDYLGYYRVTVGDDPTAGADADYAATLAPAAAVVDNQIQHAPDSPAAALAAQGDNAGQIRAGVVQYLPPPDTPIDTTQEAPPRPGGQILPGDFEGPIGHGVILYPR